MLNNRPQPIHTPQRVAKRLTPQQVTKELLQVYDRKPPEEQQRIRHQLKLAQHSYELWRIDQDAAHGAAAYNNSVTIESHAATEAYRAAFRKRNDIWTDNDGDFIGSLHPERVVKY